MPNPRPSNLKLIADDYGLGDGHDRVMRALLEAGAIHAVSVLVETCSAASAEKLRAVAPAGGIGLHFNLTYAPPDAPPRPSRDRLLVTASLGLGRAAARQNLTRQRTRFEELFGRPPDFYDGHEHVHAFPTLRDPVLEAAARDHRSVRSMVPLDPPQGLKARVLAGLGRSMSRAATASGVDTNWRFAGVLPINAPDRAIADLEAQLSRACHLAPDAPGPIWFMVHPGDADDPRQVPGHPPRLRALEAAFLMSQPPAAGV